MIFRDFVNLRLVFNPYFFFENGFNLKVERLRLILEPWSKDPLESDCGSPYDDKRELLLAYCLLLKPGKGWIPKDISLLENDATDFGLGDTFSASDVVLEDDLVKGIEIERLRVFDDVSGEE